MFSMGILETSRDRRNRRYFEKKIILEMPPYFYNAGIFNSTYIKSVNTKVVEDDVPNQIFSFNYIGTYDVNL